MVERKSLDIRNIADAKRKVSDLKVIGNGDAFRLVSKTVSEQQGWMESTKALNIRGVGVVLKVTTQQRNPDGSYVIAEALTFVPGSLAIEDQDNPGGQKLIKF